MVRLNVRHSKVSREPSATFSLAHKAKKLNEKGTRRKVFFCEIILWSTGAIVSNKWYKIEKVTRCWSFSRRNDDDEGVWLTITITSRVDKARWLMVKVCAQTSEPILCCFSCQLTAINEILPVANYSCSLSDSFTAWNLTVEFKTCLLSLFVSVNFLNNLFAAHK